VYIMEGQREDQTFEGATKKQIRQGEEDKETAEESESSRYALEASLRIKTIGFMASLIYIHHCCSSL